MQAHPFRRKLSSFQVIILAFLGVILMGTALLMLPVSSRDGRAAGFSDALFTAVSAVCVTGLVVRDTALSWTAFGQGTILVLIQIGGLGIVAVAAFVTALSGRKIDLARRSALKDSLSAPQIGGVVRMTRSVFRFTLAAEAAGFAAMLPFFVSRYGREGIFPALFHSVSAFCNAGFDVMGEKTGAYSSLTSFAGNAGVVVPISLLIIQGGIGFMTWDDACAHGPHFRRYRMQSKVILTVTALLITVPALLFFFLEYREEPVGRRILMSLFHAVTPRTAGFNTASLNDMSPSGRLVTEILMFIGGAPGSTAGGIKTTTAAVLFANALSVFRRKKNARLFSRRIEDSAVKNASALMILYLFLTLSFAAVISRAEGLPLGDCLFETVSAVGTVGLSLGITPSLGGLSRALLMFLMFFGRVGGLTLMLAALGNGPAEVSRFPVEKIAVG